MTASREAYGPAGLANRRGCASWLYALVLLFILDGTARARSLLPSDVQVSPITDSDERRATLSRIESDLERYAPPGTELADCPVLIDDVERMASGHDTSFGGVCQISSGGKIHSITLCDDRLIGKFFQVNELLNEIDQIGLFVQAHCPPGG